MGESPFILNSQLDNFAIAFFYCIKIRLISHKFPSIIIMAENADLLTFNFKELQFELRAQGLVNQIKPFSGESGRSLKAWAWDMEKVGVTINHDTVNV